MRLILDAQHRLATHALDQPVEPRVAVPHACVAEDVRDCHGVDSHDTPLAEERPHPQRRRAVLPEQRVVPVINRRRVDGEQAAEHWTDGHRPTQVAERDGALSVRIEVQVERDGGAQEGYEKGWERADGKDAQVRALPKRSEKGRGHTSRFNCGELEQETRDEDVKVRRRQHQRHLYTHSDAPPSASSEWVSVSCETMLMQHYLRVHALFSTSSATP